MFSFDTDDNDSLICESAAADEFNEFVSLMQDISANEEFLEDSNTAHEEISDTYVYTEELASLIEEIEVDKVAWGLKETKDESTESELLYEGSRITVGESLALTMAFIMRHKLSMVASNDLISLLELHCPKENNAVKGLSQFKEYFQYLKHPMKKHFCCPNPKCQVYISVGKPKDGDVCRICRGPLSEKSFFIELPVEEQLQTILSRKLYSYFVHVCCMYYSKNPGFSQNFQQVRENFKWPATTSFLAKATPKNVCIFSVSSWCGQVKSTATVTRASGEP